ncbi:hypothetical protein AB4Z10_03710 [Bosea sp. RAF48]|uniref:hypothetical protein n=1 Tax=Bosea sp. RAF48 TaxID=3237480 RepID=UPI003F8F3D95
MKKLIPARLKKRLHGVFLVTIMVLGGALTVAWFLFLGCVAWEMLSWAQSISGA